MTPGVMMFKACACGHLGSQHRDDKTCARCECVRYRRPMHRHVGEFAGSTDTGHGKDRTRKTSHVGPS